MAQEGDTEGAWYFHDGRWWARCSSIASNSADFKHIPVGILENKMRIGTKVHEGIHEFIEGGFSPLEDDEVPYFDSYCEWEKHLNPKYIQTETRYYHEGKGITGQIDGLAILEGEDVPVIIDFKTSFAESPSWILQGHLYHYIVSETGIKIAPSVLFLKLDKEGRMPKAFRYKFDPNQRAKCMNLIEEFMKRETPPCK